jgi:hypothetical protein
MNKTYTDEQVNAICEEWGWSACECSNEYEDSIQVCTHRHDDYFGRFNKTTDGTYNFELKDV